MPPVLTPGSIADLGGGGSGAVDSVNGQIGVVVLDHADVGAAPAVLEVVRRITAGDYGTGSVGFGWREPFGSGEDITLAAVAGDLIEVSLNGQWAAANSSDFLDVALVNSYQHVGDGTTTAVTGTSGNGAPGWATNQSSYLDPITGSVFYTVVPGDISGGNIAARVITRTLTGRTLLANATTPLLFAVRNHGQ